MPFKSHPDKESSGWSLTSERVGKNPDGLDLPALLDRIESELANADSAVQWTMNSFAIGEKLGIYPGVQGLHFSVRPDLDQRTGAPAGLT